MLIGYSEVLFGCSEVLLGCSEVLLRVFRGVHMLFTGKVLALQCGVKFIGEGDSVGVGTFHDLCERRGRPVQKKGKAGVKEGEGRKIHSGVRSP